MVAGQQHDRQICAYNDTGCPIKQVVRHAMIVERVAGKQNDIRAVMLRCVQDGTQRRHRIAAAMHSYRPVMLHVQIGAVNDYNFLV
jgi:hypothetical protein